MNNAQVQHLQAPGCFGAASTFSGDSKACQACPQFDACREESIATLERIRDRIDVSDILRQHESARLKAVARKNIQDALKVGEVAEVKSVKQPRAVAKAVVRETKVVRVRFEISDEDMAIINSIPNVKVKTAAMSMVEQNTIRDVKSSLPKGINPMTRKQFQWARVACDMLIEGGFSLAALQARYMSEFEWQKMTAGPHASMLIGLFKAFGIITGNNEHYVLNPNLPVDNNAIQ
jgi:hypothetical protein